MSKILFSILVCAVTLFAQSGTIQYPNYENVKADNDTLTEAYLSYLELVSKGNSLHDQQMYSEALTCYRSADSLYPGTYLPLYEMAFTFMRMNLRDSSIYYAKKSIAIEPFENSYSLIGDNYDEMGQLDSALKYYDLGLQAFPLSHFLMYNKAVALNSNKRNLEALEVLKKSILVTKRHEGSYFLASELSIQNYLLIDFFADGSYSMLIGNTLARKKRFVENFQNVFNFFLKQEKNSLPLNVHDAFAHNFIYHLKQVMQTDNNLVEKVKTSEYEKMVWAGVYAVREIARTNYNYTLKQFFKTIVEAEAEEAYCRYVFKTMDEIGFNSWIMMNPQKVKIFANLLQHYWDEEL